ncbi:MAG: branched-chain amino acid ABC transporter permease [Planctomycetaceae bacterium]|nr:branched-chain amino acid ABC transporter permease [Planctomycetaceae bacterium]
MTTKTRNLVLTLAAVGVAYVVIFIIDNHLDAYKIRILNLIAINAILAVSLNFIYGFGGMFSLGHSGFMAIGAYTSALLILSPAQKEMMWMLQDVAWPFSVLQTPFWFSLIAGGFVAAAFSLVIALPVLRLGGDYLGIATLGFAEIIRVLIVNWASITNGSLGIKGIPPHATLYVNYTCLFVTLYCIVRLLHSNFGNVIKAIRDDEIAAKVMGINTFRYRVLAFCVGAFFAGIGGALQGNLITTIDPNMFTFLLTYNVLMIVVAGGLGSITGSIIGSIIITVMLEWLRIADSAFSIGGLTIPGVPGMRMVIFAVALLAIILYRREGIMGMHEFSWNWLFGRGRGNK